MSSKKLYREDGSEEWRLNGKLHRMDGPAITQLNGLKEWWLNGKRHRMDGPAIIYIDGTEEWWLNGKLHREGGPVITYDDGTEYWYYEGKELSKEDYKKIIKRNKNLARWVYEQWYTHFMRNPYTERGIKYINKDYERMIKMKK